MQRVSSVPGTPLRGQSITVSPLGRLALLTEEELIIFESSDDLNFLISPAISVSTSFRPHAVYTLPDFTHKTGKHGTTRFDSIAWISDESLLISGYRDGDPMIDIFHRSSRTAQSLLTTLPELWASAQLLAIDQSIGSLFDKYPNCFSLLRRPLVTSAGIAVGNIFLANVCQSGSSVFGIEMDADLSAVGIFEKKFVIGTVKGGLHVIDVSNNSRQEVFSKNQFPIKKIACMRMHADDPSTGGLAVACLTGNRLIAKIMDAMQIWELADISDVKVNEPLGVLMAIKESGKIALLRLNSEGFTVMREISMNMSGKICSSAVSANGTFLYFTVSSKRLELFRQSLVSDAKEISDLFSRRASFASLEDVYSSIARLAKISERPETCDLTLVGFMKRLGLSWTAGETVADKFSLMVGLHCLYWKLYRLKSATRSSQVLVNENDERIFVQMSTKTPRFASDCALCGAATRFESFSRRIVCENNHWLVVSALSGEVMAWDVDTFSCRHCGSCGEHEAVCPVCKGSILGSYDCSV